MFILSCVYLCQYSPQLLLLAIWYACHQWLYCRSLLIVWQRVELNNARAALDILTVYTGQAPGAVYTEADVGGPPLLTHTPGSAGVAVASLELLVTVETCPCQENIRN